MLAKLSDCCVLRKKRLDVVNIIKCKVGMRDIHGNKDQR